MAQLIIGSDGKDLARVRIRQGVPAIRCGGNGNAAVDACQNQTDRGKAIVQGRNRTINRDSPSGMRPSRRLGGHKDQRWSTAAR